MRNFGVYKMNWIVARCNPLHPGYSEDPNVVRRWQNGVQYEVAMVLRYLRNDFPQPRADRFYCDDIDKQNYIHCSTSTVFGYNVSHRPSKCMMMQQKKVEVNLKVGLYFRGATIMDFGKIAGLLWLKH